MSSPAIYGGSRTKILTSKGLLLKDGTPIDYNGQKNYITKGTFATNATTGWNLKRTTLSNLIPNQVAASWTTPSVLSVTATSTGALTQAGFSLSLAASGVTTAGDMLVSDSYTIDIEDQAKTLAFKFSYKAYTNPTNLVFAGNSTNTFHVYIYDDVNSAWIQPAGCYSTVQSSGVGIATGTFQTPANMTSFRIAIISCNASLSTTGGGAFTMYFDNFSVGPQITNMGVPVTDWVSYTPTLTNGTNAASTAKWRRVGDTMELSLEITWSGAGSGATSVLASMPSGYVMDLAKTLNSGELGEGHWYRGSSGFDSTQIKVQSNTQFQFTKPLSNSFLIGTDFSSGHVIAVTARVPISGWSSNTVMSDTTRVAPTTQVFTSGSGTYTTPAGVKYIRVRLVGGGGGGGGSGTGDGGGNAGAGGNTSFGTSLLVGNGGGGGLGYSVSNGPQNNYTLNASGIALPGGAGGAGIVGFNNSSYTYSPGGVGGNSFLGGGGGSTPFGAGVNAPSNSGAGGGGGGNNGVTNSRTGSGGSAGCGIDAIINNPNSTYSYAIGAGGTAGTAGTSGYAGGSGGSGIIIVEEYYRSEGSIAASETVAVEGYISATTTIGTTETQIVNLTTSLDYTSSFSSNTFAAPVSGLYFIDADIMFNVTYTSAGTISLYIRKGAGTIKLSRSPVITSSSYINVKTSRTIKLLAGETLSLYASKESGLSTVLAHNDSNGSRFSITRVGNY